MKRRATLMTFNIAHGRGLSLYQGFHSSRGIFKNLDRIASVIEQYQPDIVALQEIDESSHWNDHINLLDYLQSATHYPFAIHGIHNRRAGRKPLAYGNAFLSKFPVKSWEAVAFGSKTLGEKGFLEARFDAAGTELDVINLHLDFRSKRSRIQQAERIIEKIQERSLSDPYHSPPIICGDFNTSRRAASDALHHLIERHATDHNSYEYFPKSQATFPAHFPSRGLDFILLAEPYQVASCDVLRCYASDHLPVLMSFDYPDLMTPPRQAADRDAQGAALEK